MWPLFKENVRYILRAKLVLMLLAFSFAVHYIGFKLMNHLTVSFQGKISIIGSKDVIFSSLYMQLFTGVFLVVVYGIWMAPYAHRGERGVLTYVLPVSKWSFPACYSICCLFLILLNQLVMLGSFGAVFGWSTFSNDFPWSGISSALLIETLALEVIMLALSVGSLSFGQVPTFFLGAIVIFVLQVVGGLAGITNGSEEGTMSTWQTVLAIYHKLPPVGELVFDLKDVFSRRTMHWDHVGLWAIWFVVFVVLFRFKLRYPLKMRSTES